MSPQQTPSSPRLQAWLDSVSDYSTADGEMHYYQFDIIDGVDPANLVLHPADEQQQQQQQQQT
ncbi:hypothetical protein MN608_10829 [Microdochium nivale]|nr:hypothetical protein MN608_10829 [Microdochium nivale]